MAQMSDTGTTMYYDDVLKKYVGYFRMSFMNRRVIGRRKAQPWTRRGPAPELVVWTDPAELPSNDYYTNGKSLYPGTKTAHLMFPTILQPVLGQLGDTDDVQHRGQKLDVGARRREDFRAWPLRKPGRWVRVRGKRPGRNRR